MVNGSDADDNNVSFDYLKYRFDGAATPTELANALREAAMFYDDLTAAGVTHFDQPVDGGHVIWTTPSTSAPSDN